MRVTVRVMAIARDTHIIEDELLSYSSQGKHQVSSQDDYQCQRYGQCQNQVEGLGEGKYKNWVRVKVRSSSGS